MTAQTKETSGKPRPIRKTAFMMFKKCQRKFFYFYNQPDEIYNGYGQESDNEALRRGTQFHNACEKFFEKFTDVKNQGSYEFFRLSLPEKTELIDSTWFDWFAKVEYDRYKKYEEKGWLEYFIPKDLELPLYLKDIIDRTGHIDRIDYLPDEKVYCIVEYKTGRSYNVNKQYSLSDLRAEIGFYQIMLNAAQIYDKPVTHWKLINPTLEQVYQEKIPSLSLSSVQSTYRKMLEKIKGKGPWERKIDLLCLWCPFAQSCLFPVEEEKPIFGKLAKELEDAKIDYV